MSGKWVITMKNPDGCYIRRVIEVEDGDEQIPTGAIGFELSVILKAMCCRELDVAAHIIEFREPTTGINDRITAAEEALRDVAEEVVLAWYAHDESSK